MTDEEIEGYARLIRQGAASGQRCDSCRRPFDALTLRAVRLEDVEPGSVYLMLTTAGQWWCVFENGDRLESLGGDTYHSRDTVQALWLLEEEERR